MTRRHLSLAVALVLAGCSPSLEPCFWQDLRVSLSATPSRGKAPLAVQLTAIGTGFACGCCGGKQTTTVVSYSWDLDGDDRIDESGPATTTRSLVLDSPGSRKVTVVVGDSAGGRARDDVLLVAEDAAAARDAGSDGR